MDTMGMESLRFDWSGGVRLADGWRVERRGDWPVIRCETTAPDVHDDGGRGLVEHDYRCRGSHFKDSACWVNLPVGSIYPPK